DRPDVSSEAAGDGAVGGGVPVGHRQVPGQPLPVAAGVPAQRRQSHGPEGGVTESAGTPKARGPVRAAASRPYGAPSPWPVGRGAHPPPNQARNQRNLPSLLS